jgi:hypothetical protein
VFLVGRDISSEIKEGDFKEKTNCYHPMDYSQVQCTRSHRNTQNEEKEIVKDREVFCPFDGGLIFHKSLFSLTTIKE